VDNADKIKQYYIDNKEEIHKRHGQYYIDNKERLLDQAKQYYIGNKEEIHKRHGQYYIDNKERLLDQVKQYRATNRDKLAVQHNRKCVCVCNGKYTHQNIQIHSRTSKHQKYLRDQQLEAFIQTNPTLDDAVKHAYLFI
jgi:hypothetical protein